MRQKVQEEAIKIMTRMSTSLNMTLMERTKLIEDLNTMKGQVAKLREQRDRLVG